MRRYLLLVVLGFVLTSAVLAQEVLTSRVQRVALFKNGYGCIVREVTIPAGARESVIRDVPLPVHGTFWIVTPEGITVQAVTALEGEGTQTVPAITLPELLLANVGETIEVKTGEAWLKGKLLSVAGNRETKAAAPAPIPVIDPYRSGYYGYPLPAALAAPQPVETGDLLLLDTAEGVVALPVSSISQVRKAGGALKTTFARTAPGAILRLRTAGRGGTAQIAYLTRGLTWAPSYYLDLTGKTPRLLAKAVLVNDAEDLEAEELSCVAGFPNIKFAGVVDPLAMQNSVAQFLQSLQNPTAGPTQPSVMTQAVTMNSVQVSSTEDMVPSMPGDDGDLHFYPFKGVALRKGERAYLPIFEIDTPSIDVYRWTVQDLRRRNNGYYDQRESAVAPVEDIWHAVRLKNTGKVPWTSAPVMITENGQFLGQDLLYYTPAGGSTLVNINKAVDVRGQNREDTDDTKGTVRILDFDYRVFRINGNLTVANFKGTPVRLIITKNLTGDVLDTSVKPESNVEEPRWDIANAHRTITWEIEIPAGKTKEITYTYKMNVR